MSTLNKVAIERNQKALLELVNKPGNNICADCKARNPRWASHNLGIFICVHCASIHRKIGTHISKVKSVTMDTWTKEQTENMKEIGNLKSNAIYNPNEVRHPPPPSMEDAERDSELEQYIRSKYEYKRFLDKSALVASKLGPSRSAASISQRPQSTPLDSFKNTTSTSSATTQFARPNTAALPPSAPSRPSAAPQVAPSRSVSQPLSAASYQSQQPLQSAVVNTPQSGVWADLIALQAPSAGPSLPLQYQMASPINPSMQQQQIPQLQMGTNAFGPSSAGLQSAYSMQSFSPGTGNPGLTPTGYGMGTGSTNPFQLQQQQQQQQQFAPNPFSQPSFSSPTQGTGAALFGLQPQQQQFYNSQPTMQSPIMQSQNPAFSQFQPQQQQQQQQQPIYAPQAQMLGQQQQQQLSHSPQPFYSSTTPQLQGQFMSTTPQPQFNGGGFVGQQQGQQQGQGQQQFMAGGWNNTGAYPNMQGQNQQWGGM